MKQKEINLTPEQYKVVCILDSILMASCTNEEESKQMIKIIKNRKKQIKKLAHTSPQR